jgi:hypothetical protein
MPLVQGLRGSEGPLPTMCNGHPLPWIRSHTEHWFPGSTLSVFHDFQTLTFMFQALNEI